MTTEEIEKAVEEYAESLKSIEPKTLIGRAMPYALRGAFKEGLEFSDKHWQEKTRWKSLETEPPKFVGQKYEVLVRYSPGIHDIVCIVGLRSVERAIAAGYKDWKEIE